MRTRRKQIISVVLMITIAAGSLLYTFLSSNTPLLGLDLQGGLSVVLKPKQTVGDEQIQQAISIIRQRIDAIGVAEPEISQQGDNILIQIPGVDDKDRALQLVGQTAELRFRPVMSYCTVATAVPDSSSTTTPPSSTPVTTAAGAPADPNAPTSVAPASSTPAAPTSVNPTPTSQGAFGLVEGESAAGLQAPTPSDPTATPAPSTPTASTPADPTASTPTASLTPEQQQQLQQQLQQQGAGAGAASGAAFQPNQPCPPGAEKQITSADNDKADQTVILPGYEDKDDPKKLTTLYQLGPADATGSILSDASASLNPQGATWVVNPKFKPGADGIDKFNASAQNCKPAGAKCPTGRQAITLDGRVVSAPNIQPDAQSFAPFDADKVQISGNFTEQSAKELATQLKYGALPVELQQQQAQEVSATLGRDALKAGLISGFVGLAIVGLYMIFFYRLLGVMAVFKLFIEGAIIWSFIAFLGSHVGLALTLAGVTGLIVSIGVSLDSNVVYYEHLKEDLRNGRTLRSAVDKAFNSSFKTILKADGVSILGAVLLYMLSVGPVRGFAFYLILAMVLDLFTSRYYMHPAVLLACRSKFADRRPGLFGLPGVDSEEIAAAKAAANRGGTIAARPSKNKGRERDSEPEEGEDDESDAASQDEASTGATT